MIDSKMTTRVSTCYFLGSIKMKSIENNGMVQIMEWSIMQPLTRRKYVLRWENVQNILSEKIKLQNITQWAPLGLLLSTLHMFIKQEDLGKDIPKCTRGGGFYYYFCILFCDLHMHEYTTGIL